MRRTSILVLAAAAGVALTAGCAGSPRQVAGEAAPVGGVTMPPPASTPTTPAATATSASPSSTPSRAVPTTPTSKPPKSAVTDTEALVLGPRGLGKLKIGMTVEAADATGEIDASGTGCGSAKLKAADDAAAEVRYSDRGLLFIPAYGRIATPEGIRIGSTLAQVKRVYPDFVVNTIDEDNGFTDTGRAYAGREDGYDGVHYAFFFKAGLLDELALQHDEQNCWD